MKQNAAVKSVNGIAFCINIFVHHDFVMQVKGQMSNVDTTQEMSD